MSPVRLVWRGAALTRGELRVPADVARHARVTRVTSGEEVEVLDLAGGVAAGRLVTWEGRSCIVEIQDLWFERGEPPAPLVLALGVLHTDAFAWTVEKATELGATEVVPVLSARVQSRDHARRVERWQRVADAAVAQCGRSRPAKVRGPLPLAQLLASAEGVRVVADPQAGTPPDLRPERTGFTVLVGPEGGFDSDEGEAIRAGGFASLRLGPRTLRAETAAIAALTLVQRLAGWI